MLDKFHYFRKSDKHKDKMNSILNKKNKYLIKIFSSLITMRLEKVIYNFARYYAILKYNIFLKKIKIFFFNYKSQINTIKW